MKTCQSQYPKTWKRSTKTITFNELHSGWIINLPNSSLTQNVRLRGAPLLVTLKLLSGSKWTFRAATTPIKTSASAFMLPGPIAALLIAWLTQNTLIRCLQGNHPVSCKSYANLVNEQIQIKIHKAASRQHMHWLAASACSSLSNIFFFSKSAICLSDIYSFLVSSDLQVLSVYRICSRLLHRPLSDLLFRFNLLCSLFLALPSLHPALSISAPVHLSLSLDSFTITFCLRALLCDWCGHLYSVESTKKMERKVCVCMFVWIVEGWWPLTSGPHLQTDRQTDLQLWGLCVRYLWFSLRTASNLSLYLEQAGNWTLSRDLFARCCLERQEWSVKLNFGSVFLEVNI